MRDACGEFGVVAVLREEFIDWNNKLHAGRGDGYTVAGPGSLQNTARARAALMRQRGNWFGGSDMVPTWEAVWATVEPALHLSSPPSDLHPIVVAALRRAGGWDRLRNLPLETAQVKLEGEYRNLLEAMV